MSKQSIKFSALEVGSTGSERERYRDLGEPHEVSLPHIEQLERIIKAKDKKYALIKEHNSKMSIPDPAERLKICLKWLQEKHRWENMDAFADNEGFTGRTLRTYLAEMRGLIPPDMY